MYVKGIEQNIEQEKIISTKNARQQEQHQHQQQYRHCSFEQQQLLASSIQYLFHRFAHHQHFSYYVTGFDHNCDLIPKKAKISRSAVQYFLFQVHVCKLTGYCTLLLFIK
jgi:hypothetical protein